MVTYVPMSTLRVQSRRITTNHITLWQQENHFLYNLGNHIVSNKNYFKGDFRITGSRTLGVDPGGRNIPLSHFQATAVNYRLRKLILNSMKIQLAGLCVLDKIQLYPVSKPIRSVFLPSYAVMAS